MQAGNQVRFKAMEMQSSRNPLGNLLKVGHSQNPVPVDICACRTGFKHNTNNMINRLQLAVDGSDNTFLKTKSSSLLNQENLER